jgi:branched-chain amino acid transport system substrate-binding protein
MTGRMLPRVRRRPVVVVAVIGILTVTASSCGIREPHSAVISAQNRVIAIKSHTTSHDVAGIAPSSGSTTISVPGAAATKSSSGGSLTGPTSPSTSAAKSSSATAAPTQANLSPVYIGNVGTYSGPAGQVLAGIPQGVQIWVAYANAHGGVNGHPVKVLVDDDQSSPSAHEADVQQMVQQDHVIAFVGNSDAVAGAGSESYIDSAKIPVIGGDTAEQYYNTDPMYFPQATGGNAEVESGMFGAASVTSVRNLGIITSSDSSTGAQELSEERTYAPQAGFNVVYSTQASIATPDFTAQCLAAQQAKVQVFGVALDDNSIARLVSDCAQQNFHPIYIFGASLDETSQETNPDLQGTISPGNVYPWFLDNSPAAQAFQVAVKEYAPGTPASSAIMTGWIAGLLFGEAAAQLPTSPTSQDVLNGLWSIKDNTLGGLTYPLTFTHGQPTLTPACWFNETISNSAWVSPDNGALHCH